MSENELFVILPYLKTSSPVTVRGIQFRSSDDIEFLPKETRDNLKTLFSLFFLQDNLQIKRMTYAYFNPDNLPKNVGNVFQRLREAQSIITYLYCSPDMDGSPFFSLEHSSLYLFLRDKVDKYLMRPDYMFERGIVEDIAPLLPDGQDTMDGYSVSLNFRSQFWVVSGSRVYPPVPGMWLNITQDMSYDFDISFSSSKFWALADLAFARSQISNQLEDRIFTAIRWYNRSNAMNISEEDALVNLAIAFESLFQIEQDKDAPKRFKDVIMILLGSIPRLDSWVEQFYAARSEIVHEGKQSHQGFYAVDKKQFSDIQKGNKQDTPYRALSMYGRMIFRICLMSVLAGAKLAEEAELSSHFVHNEERLKNVRDEISKNYGNPEEKLQSVSSHAFELHKYQRRSDKDLDARLVFLVGRLAAKTYLQTNPEIPEQIQNLFGQIANSSNDTSNYDMFMLFMKTNTEIMRWQGRDLKDEIKRGNIDKLNVFNVVWSIIDFSAQIVYPIWPSNS